jgi:type I restriction enzyme S subunit
VRKVYELEKKAKSIIPGISREDILTALIPLPPLAEQHRIVAKIEELLSKIDKLKTK